jgi:uncharacterized membrane protein
MPMLARPGCPFVRGVVVALLAGIGLIATSTIAASPESGFWLTGLAPGTYAGQVTALNQDGNMAAGWNQFPVTFNSPGYTWTREEGRNDLGLLPGMPDATYTHGLSDTGAVVGLMYNWGGGFTRAFRWTGTGLPEDLGTMGLKDSYAWGISGDGKVVVGHVENSGPFTFPYQAFRWTPTEGMQGLGWLPQSGSSRANGVSRDGQTVVGVSMIGLDDRAFVWTQATGMKALPLLPGATYPWCAANAVSADGSVVVGSSYGPDGKSYPVRWVFGQVENLSLDPFYSSIQAYAVCDDGSVIGGGGGGLAFVWSTETGIMEASEYLASRGVTVPPDQKIWGVSAISGDGLTIAGGAVSMQTNQGMGFVATLPTTSCQADCDASAALDIDDFICFQTYFALGDAKADCDKSGWLNIDDFVCFQTVFALGC